MIPIKVTNDIFVTLLVPKYSGEKSRKAKNRTDLVLRDLSVVLAKNGRRTKFACNSSFSIKKFVNRLFCLTLFYDNYYQLSRTKVLEGPRYFLFGSLFY